MPETALIRAGFPLILLLGLLAGSGGCRDKEVSVYRIPKEPDAVAGGPSASPAAAPSPQARWTVPAGWKVEAASGMRLGSFRAIGAAGASADISVIAFPGTGGDDLANINRWRGQAGLPPIAAEALASQIGSLDAPAGKFVLADLSGTSPTDHSPIRLVGAWLRRPGRVWFFKMMGPAAVVDSQNGAFREFLNSVVITESAAGGPTAQPESGNGTANTNDLPADAGGLGPLPAGHPPMTNEASQTAAPSPLTWQAPSHWVKRAASGMRLGSFSAVGPDGASADISVIAFPGTGGDDLANINRWRGQVGLPPIAAEALASQTDNLETAAGKFVLADLSGTSPTDHSPIRLVGAWLRLPDRVWFFKMMGPAAVVGSENGAFREFLKTVAVTGTAVPSSPMPSGPVPTITAADETAAPSPLTWQAPSDWAKRAASSMRKGSFSLGADRSVDLAITVFPGDVGGTLANVNRWLGQVGLPPITESELDQLTVPLQSAGLTFTVVDTAAKDHSAPQRIVAGLLPWNGNTWFFKLSGATEKVEQQKPAFLQFLHTVRPTPSP